jgi:vacuolar-type H+-ATPase subunit I/STV1
MKLVYKILWIDNEDSIYKNHQDTIKEHLENLGFEPQIKKLQDFQSFESANLALDSYDLFLLDYKLKNGENGNKIVQEIREKHSVYTEIIFYSGVAEQARKQIFDDKLNGVYITSRDYEEFEDDVLGIIDVTIKKTQDINNLRGLIMAEVAELDRLKEKIIIKATVITEEFDTKKYILKTLKKSYDDNLKQVEKYKEDSIETILDKLYVDSDKKARTINKINGSFDAKIYRNIILEKRNKFAHIEECDGVDEHGNACKVIGDIPFTEENCIKIRKEIKNYKDILKEIEKFI